MLGFSKEKLPFESAFINLLFTKSGKYAPHTTIQGNWTYSGVKHFSHHTWRAIFISIENTQPRVICI